MTNVILGLFLFNLIFAGFAIGWNSALWWVTKEEDKQLLMKKQLQKLQLKQAEKQP